MIRPAPGVAFTTAADGDMRSDVARRPSVGSAGWATVRQIHGASVVEATGPGDHGDADGVWTKVPGLPLAVFTADCLGIVIHGRDQVVAVAHAGWRGVVGGVVEEALAAVGEVQSVHIGPHIRSCCFEVGDEVAALFAGHVAATTWGTSSVDLAAAVTARLPVRPEVVEICTRCGADTFSHRRDGTTARMAAIGWLP